MQCNLRATEILCAHPQMSQIAFTCTGNVASLLLLLLLFSFALVTTSPLEVVGSHCTSNQSSCSFHALCGDHIALGDMLHLAKCAIECNVTLENAIKCTEVVDGVDTCTNAEAHQQVCAGGGALWTFLSNAQKQAKAHANCGIASMQLLAKDKSCN